MGHLCKPAASSLIKASDQLSFIKLFQGGFYKALLITNFLVGKKVALIVIKLTSADHPYKVQTLEGRNRQQSSCRCVSPLAPSSVP